MATFTIDKKSFLIGITIGICTSICYNLFKNNKKKYKKLIVNTDDDCYSLFYGKTPGNNGEGYPEQYPVDNESLIRLTTVHSDYTKLNFELYKLAVECLPIVCVDVICKRKSDKKLLLFYRRDPPAANYWWWPGGRMFKGETFFDTAIRKIKDETGNQNAHIVPIGVVNVWNTFFPDSSFDKERRPGREGTQTVNITVVCELHDDVLALNSDASQLWAVDAARWISNDEAIQPSSYDKYISLNVKMATDMGYL